MKKHNRFDNSRYTYADGMPLDNVQYKQHISTRFINYQESKDKLLLKRIPHLYDHIYECCGCSACEAICPRQAISMEADEEGFLYPVVNLQKCIQCYQCEKVCAFKMRT